MSPYTQTHRKVAVKSPVGEDVLLFREMHASESLGRPFELRLELMSTDGAIKFDDVLGQAMTVALELPDDKKRYFSGIASSFTHAGQEGRLHRYQATLVPWFWFLTRSADCRIFQNKKVPDIIDKVFRDAGFSDFKKKLSGSYPQLEYCVQYRETSFDFVSRLMEEAGIYYYFEHDDGKHMLVLADAIGAHGPFTGYEKVPYRADAPSNEEYVHEWRLQRRVQPGKVVVTDYDFQSPRKDLTARSNGSLRHARADGEVFDFPGRYVETADGDARAKVWREELHAGHEVADGKATSRGLRPGYLVKLTDHPRGDQNREHLVTECAIHLTSNEYDSTLRAGEVTFECTFSAISSKVPYRSPRHTPKPVVQGPQTAVVVGKSGEEIWTDKHGRVKVQFHWDRYGKRDENSSCWMRVSHPWAAAGWGVVHIPRIGQEVVVEFLEGDPDRPLITGCVYNGDNKPPYDLPAKATQSGIKTRSTKQGSKDNFNEIRFEDEKGKEELFIHAERDLKTGVEANESRSVGDSRSTTIEKDERLVIKKGNRDTDLEQGNDTLTVSKGNVETSAPMGDYHVTAKSVSIEATQKITLSVGASSITIEPAKISVSSPMISSAASAVQEVKGAVVKINC